MAIVVAHPRWGIYAAVRQRPSAAVEARSINYAYVPTFSEYLAAVSVLASRMLRNGFSAEAMASDFVTVESPFTGHMRGGYCPSLSALIARTLLAHVRTARRSLERLDTSSLGPMLKNMPGEGRLGSKPLP